MNILDRIREKGLDLLKETHPGKSYEEHVKECREIVEKVMKVYSFPGELIELAFLLCDLHDVGKLLYTWHITRRVRPLHSIEGAEWFMEVWRDIELDMNHSYRELIAYMIASHHSPLYVPAKFMDVISRAEKIFAKRYFTKYRRCRELANRINKLLKSMSIEMRHNLADIFGIVKMADFISAKNLPRNEILANYSRIGELESRVSRGIFERACNKRGTFDESKFDRQKTIASSMEDHILVAAPTGWGKTALALLRMTLKEPIKVFYILPTITAIKDFYENFASILDKRYLGEYFYFADVELLRMDYFDEEYPLDMYRYFIPKITITTIDQLLLTTLQAGKYYIRRFNLRNSLIVIDEFHLLTPQMIACMRVFLRDLLRSYNFSCLFMSATPSPIYEELLKEVIPHMKTIVLDNEYSRLKRHKIKYLSDHFVEELISEEDDFLEKRTMIILNTVNEAQRLYTVLNEKIGGTKKVVLIHGDFAYKDRVRKEEQINNADILISTQVAEVSLDISFDRLITELAPLPSLVQRFGRVNRYGKEASEVNVYICKPRSSRPYGHIMLQGAHETLPFLINEIERRGEAAYLSREFWQYEEIYRETVIRIEDEVSRRVDDLLLNFFSLLAQEEEILEFLGREETWLAIPEIYLNETLALYQKLRSASKYEERMNIYAQIKENLAPASHSDIKRAEWNDELKLWVIKNYDKDLGIIKYRNY